MRGECRVLVVDDEDLTLPPFLLKPFSIGALVAAVIGLLATFSAYQGENLT